MLVCWIGKNMIRRSRCWISGQSAYTIVTNMSVNGTRWVKVKKLRFAVISYRDSKGYSIKYNRIRHEFVSRNIGGP